MPAVLTPTRPHPGNRTLLTALLLAAFAASVLAAPVGDLLSGGGAAGALLGSLLRPDLTAGFLSTVAEASAVTAAYAVAAMSVALLLGMPGALLVSGVLARRRLVRAGTSATARALIAVPRAVHELVWALVLLAVLGLTPLTGVLAIAIPYGATIARVLGDRLLDVPQGPLGALRSAGASPAQILVYGRLPLAARGITSYLLYRLECAVRAAAVLSFIGLGGIGLQVEIALADLRFERVWPLLGALVLLVLVVDTASRALSRRCAA